MIGHSKILFRIAISLILLLNINFSSSQVGQEWIKRVSGTRNEGDFAKKILKDQQGKIIVMGTVDDNSTFNNVVLYKYNPDGSEIWDRKFIGPGNSDDVGEDLCIDRNNNYIIAGYINNSYQSLIIKYSSDGNLLWSRTFPYSHYLGVATDNNNNIYVSGFTDSASIIWENNPNFLLVKYGPNGNLVWTRTYEGPGNNLDIALYIGLDNNNNIYLGGYSYNGSDYTTTDIALLKYNTNGNLQWLRRYDGPGHSLDEIYSMNVNSNGDVCIAGNVKNVYPGSDLSLLKYNSNGDLLFVNLYNGPGNKYDGARDIKVDPAGNIYICGLVTVSQTDYDWDYITLKYNSSGTILWNKTYNGIGNAGDYATNITYDVNGSVYVLGVTWKTPNYDLTTLKYDLNGNLEWTQNLLGLYGGSGNQSRSILVDNPNSVFVAGALIFSGGSNRSLDYAFLKYSPVVSVQQNEIETPAYFSLSQNYPNPFNPVTKIRFDIPKSSYTSIKIYNTLGKEISTLVNEELKAGKYEASWDATSYPSGIYFYKLISEDYAETKKMILIK